MPRSRARPLVSALVLAGCTIPNPAFEVPARTSGDTGTSSTGEPGSTSTPVTTTGTSSPTTSSGGMAATTDVAPTSGLASGTSFPGTSTGVEPSTTTGPGTTGTSTGPGPGCGDGILDIGEECDDGDGANADDAACTSACKHAVCGDGLVKTQGPGESESCDDGAMNGLGAGLCSNDCKAVVAEKKLHIRLSTQTTLRGNLHHPQGMVPAGIAAGDEACDLVFGDGYQILAADGVNRQATIDPWVGGAQAKNWPLKPYTAYYNKSEQLIWVTGKEALLGIQNGIKATLINPIDAEYTYWTGLQTSWQTSADTCQGWTSTNALHLGTLGNAGLKDNYLNFGPGNCGELLGLPFVCVQTL